MSNISKKNMDKVSSGGREVSYSRTGIGAPVVFVHGSFANSSAWRGVLQNLETPDRSTIVVDLTGCGESTAAAPEPSLLSQDVEAVELVVSDTSTEPVHLVGHSYGGLVCFGAALAGRIPIASMTLFEPLPIAFLADVGEPKAVEEIRAFVEDYERAHLANENWAFSRVIRLWGGEGAFEAIPEKVRDMMDATTADNLRHWRDNLAFMPSLDDYRQLEMPTSIVVGEHANSIVKLIAAQLDQLMPNTTVHQLEGAGHFMVNSHPADCAHIIGQSVKR